MKILSITAQKPHSTGSGTYMTELVKAFDKMGHEQAVVAGIYPDDSVSFPESVSFYPVYFGTSDLPFPIVGMSDIMPYESTRYRDLSEEMIAQFETSFISVISEAVSALKPDIIFCHHLFLLTALVRKHFPDNTVYGMSHGTDLRQMLNCPEIAAIARPYIRGLDRIFALHGAQLDTICDIFEIPPDDDRLRVIGSGYNPQLFNCEGRSESAGRIPRIIYAGKLSRPKGVAELLSALDILRKDRDIPQFDVVLAGGCRDDSIRAMLEELPESIKYVGPLPQAELARLFKTGDVFVLPSYFEGLPLVIIEAMASGMLPVCTELPGIREFTEEHIPGGTVIFIPRPEMKTVDVPLDEAIPEFTFNIYNCLKNALKIARECPCRADTSAVSWDSVALRIIT